MFPAGPGGSESVDAAVELPRLARRGRQLATQIGALQAEVVDVAAPAQALEGSLASGTVRQGLGLPCGLTPAEAGRVVRLAARLAELPQLASEFADGQLPEGTDSRWRSSA